MNTVSILSDCWQGLGRIRQLQFTARSRVATGWHGDGTGLVVVERIDTATLLFHETGTWQPTSGPAIPFRNVFRWTLEDTLLRLEHLRYGPTRPIYLFDLMPGEDRALHCVAPYVCSHDVYAGSLCLKKRVLHLAWTIRGPRKDESIHYIYS